MSIPASDPPAGRAPWAHIVRGVDTETTTVVPEQAPIAEASDRSPRRLPAAAAAVEDGENNNNDNAGGNGRRSVWSRPLNGTVDVAAAPVMGALSWPALSESARTAPRLPAVFDGPVSDPLPVPPPALAIATPQPARPINNSPNPNFNRQRSLRRNGGGNNSNTNNGAPVSVEPLPPAGQEPSPRDHGSRNSGFSPQPHAGPDHHHRPYNRRNSGAGPHNGGGRQDRERGGYDWNNPPHRHLQPSLPIQPFQQRGHHPRLPFIRPAPPPPPPPAALAGTFIGGPPPPLARPFLAPPIGYSDFSPVIFFAPPPHTFITQPVHTMPPAPAVILDPAEEFQLKKLAQQIEYYFSVDNLCKDRYLRQQMDNQGWIPIAVIANFPRVKSMTEDVPNNIDFILRSLRNSEKVEVQMKVENMNDSKIRKRGDWMSWFWMSGPQPTVHPPAASNYDEVVNRMQSVGIGEGAVNNTGDATHEVLGRPVSGSFTNQASGSFTNQAQVGDLKGERNVQVAGY